MLSGSILGVANIYIFFLFTKLQRGFLIKNGQKTRPDFLFFCLKR